MEKGEKIMKKNNKGFFLAETIIVVALVTTVMAFVYPNVTKLYDNYKNRALYYDQTEDLYTLKAIYEMNEENINGKCNNLYDDDNQNNDNNLEDDDVGIVFSDLGIEKLEIYKYMDDLNAPGNYNYNRYLKRLKRPNSDYNACRLIGVFKVDDKPTRYASIKIENVVTTENAE